MPVRRRHLQLLYSFVVTVLLIRKRAAITICGNMLTHAGRFLLVSNRSAFAAGLLTQLLLLALILVQSAMHMYVSASGAASVTVAGHVFAKTNAIVFV